MQKRIHHLLWIAALGVIALPAGTAHGEEIPRCADLRTWLLGREEGTTPDQRVEDDEYRLRLMQHEMTFVVGPETLRQIEATKDGRAFVHQVLHDAAWMDHFLNSGPFQHLFRHWDRRDRRSSAARGFRNLFEIWTADRACAVDDLHKRLATAMALTEAYMPSDHRDVARYGRRGTHLEAYAFFKRSHMAGRLHRMFADYEVWVMRYLGGHGWITDSTSLSWLQENVNIPLEYYDRIFSALTYRGNNEFGLHIQRPGFHDPWDFLPDAENWYRNGGVCGTLSGWATAAACAHGIPATPVGAPGHCQYAVRYGPGDWRTGFGSGGTAGRSQYGQWNLTSIRIQEEVFADRSLLARSNAHLWRAHLYADEDPARCLAALKQALRIQPLNLEAWDAYARYLLGRDGTDWLAFTKEMAARWSRFPIVPFHIFHSLWGRLGADPSSGPDLPAFHAVLHDAASKSPHWLEGRREGTPRNQLFDQHAVAASLTHYTRTLMRHTRDKEKAAEVVFRGLVGHGAAGPGKSFDVSNWASRTFRGRDLDAWLRVLSKNEEILDSAQASELYRSLVLRAAARLDVAAFNQLTTTGRRHWTAADKRQVRVNAAMPQFERFEGSLLTKGGVLRTYGSISRDAPLLHASVLTEEGGWMCGGRATKPWAIVRMPKLGKLNGIVIVNDFRLERVWSRALPLTIYASEDGRRWNEITTLTTATRGYWRIDLGGRNVKARYVKLAKESGEAAPFFHLRAILAYGTPLE